MQKENTIIIWDRVPQRISSMEADILCVLKQLNIDATIQVNCEIPLIFRNQLSGKLPSFQVNNGDIWTLTPDKVVTKEEFLCLFTHLKELGLFS